MGTGIISLLTNKVYIDILESIKQGGSMTKFIGFQESKGSDEFLDVIAGIIFLILAVIIFT